MSIFDTLLEKVGPTIGLLFVMFVVLMGVTKLWDNSWHTSVKVAMALVLFSVEIGCMAVMPFGIGKAAMGVFTGIWNKLF